MKHTHAQTIQYAHIDANTFLHIKHTCTNTTYTRTKLTYIQYTHFLTQTHTITHKHYNLRNTHKIQTHTQKHTCSHERKASPPTAITTINHLRFARTFLEMLQTGPDPGLPGAQLLQRTHTHSYHSVHLKVRNMSHIL